MLFVSIMTDTILCKVQGIPNPITKSNPMPTPRTHTRNNTTKTKNTTPTEIYDTVKINGIYSESDKNKVKKWLGLYGEIEGDITEDHHHDPDPNSPKVGKGIFSVNEGFFLGTF